MTMTDEEICRDYRAAKSPLKQVGILADLNNCPKAKIKEILIAGGCTLPKQMQPKPKGPRQPAPETPSAEPDGYVKIRDALPLLIGQAALKVISEMAKTYGNSEDDQFFFRARVDGIMALVDEIDRRCSE